MIEFDGVSKKYDGQTAIRDVSFSVKKGELVFISGHSGAGKSTILKLVTAFEKPTSGIVRVGDFELNRIKDRQLPFYRRKLGVVYQNHQLLMERTIFDNVALPLQVTGLADHIVAKRVRAALDKVGLLNAENKRPKQLSGGEQQRVGIARAVVHKPDVIVADEPTGNLDPVLSREIMKLFVEFNKVGTTVMVVTHDLDLVARLNHRVLTMKHGSLLKSPFGS